MNLVEVIISLGAGAFISAVGFQLFDQSFKSSKAGEELRQREYLSMDIRTQLDCKTTKSAPDFKCDGSPVLLYKKNGKPFTSDLESEGIFKGAGMYGNFAIKTSCLDGSFEIRVAKKQSKNGEVSFSKNILNGKDFDFSSPPNPLFKSVDGLCDMATNVEPEDIKGRFVVLESMQDLGLKKSYTAPQSKTKIASSSYTPEGEVIKLRFESEILTHNSDHDPSKPNDKVEIDIYLRVHQAGVVLLDLKMTRFKSIWDSLYVPFSLEKILNTLKDIPLTVEVYAESRDGRNQASFVPVNLTKGVLWITDYVEKK